MKKFLLLTAIGLVLTLPRSGFAVCNESGCDTMDDRDEDCWGDYEDFNLEVTENCSDYSYFYNGCDKVYSCNTCSPGMVLQTHEYTPKYTYNSCEERCTTANCSSDVDWSNGNTGYQYLVKRGCKVDGITCETETRYRCAPGFWGSSTNGTTGCTRCPEYQGGIFGTSAAGATSQSECYVPDGTGGKDETGSWKYQNACYYK